MALLGAAMVAGLGAIWRWGSFDLEVPWESGHLPMTVKETLHRYLWYVTVGLAGSVVAGIVMLGAGGRLVMRLLAVTAGSDAQGVITEADEIVGEITLGGTLGFIAFVGILGGSLLGLVFMLVRHWLPGGIWRGVTFGVLVMVVLATRADPLRPDNPDFDLVGPDWVAVLAFAAILIGYGMLLSAIVGRYSRFLPLLKRDLKTIAKYVPAYVLSALALPALAIPVVGVGVLAVVSTRIKRIDRILSSERIVMIGRALIVLVAAVAVPGFVMGVADILGN